MASCKDRYPSYEIAKARMRERYHSDPEYRAVRIEAAKKWNREQYKDPVYRMVISIKRRERYKRKKLEALENKK